MKNIEKNIILFISPLLLLFSYLVMILESDGLISFLSWLFEAIFIPIIHFSIAGYFIRNKISNAWKIILATALYYIMIVICNGVISALLTTGSSLLWYTVCKILWASICGFMIIGHTLIEVTGLSGILLKCIVTAEALLALIVNSLLTWILCPVLLRRVAMEGIEIPLLLLSAVFLSLFSYLLGTVLTKQRMVWKLVAWLVGVMVSVFICLWLLGTPRTIPFASCLMTVIWLVASLFIFVWSLVGSYLRNKKKSHLD